MNNILSERILAFCLLIFAVSTLAQGQQYAKKVSKSHYLQNSRPLLEKPYLELPLGNIQPKGWIKDQLLRMKTGLTGNLDEIYPEVMGPRNGWLGGDGDGWERGPYWIDGLLPLAYLLDDEELKAKVQPWIEWTLKNQQENGYLGPIPFESEPAYEPGLQRGMRKDWWPKMVMLKILQQYYNATGDQRVISALTKYFKYQLEELPNTPLDKWTFWANRRGGDNLQVVYWLYNITGDKFLLDLGELLTEQTFPWSQVFLNEENHTDPTSPWYFYQMKRYPFDQEEISSLTVSKIGGIHTVNLAQGLKQPIIQYQYDKDVNHLKALKEALADLKKYHGQPQGMYGGDEPLHGNKPTQGIEFCSIAEGMFSLESILQITGDMQYADQLEKIAYNALPTQASDDFMSRQYFQAANQVKLTDQLQTSFETNHHKGTDFVFGTLSGYPCCTSNMHQAWPKFVQNLWYATHDGGVAALLYAPSEVALKVADDVDLKVIEATGYPFRDQVHFSMELSESASFPFHLRIPDWAKRPVITINGEEWKGDIHNQLAIIDRSWKNGDKVTLTLPMELKHSQWYSFSAAIERGPLVYSLKIKEKQVCKNRNDGYREFYEYIPAEEWKYGLLGSDLADLNKFVEVTENKWNGEYPWNLENSPISLKMRGVKAADWTLENDAPELPGFWSKRVREEDIVDEITLVPYGCTTLRITEFPVYEK
ncbi:beta-L-arabinofuranosidase domain-containing protein [Echinicola shivajiensis]|uniref:beta-L-arabinofuranosidase domain-containing protein n=1 Tax=Echinicola shivajiensis TaxID=1035916 RepID=UPI001BFC9DF6|nr:beta-L-arabinofuranosidase domain-containing protein [Echinicola shivajiensis]